MSDTQQGPGWWWASDGKWYPPETFPGRTQGWWIGFDGNWHPPNPGPQRTKQEKIVAQFAATYVVVYGFLVLLLIAFVIWLMV